MVSWSVAVILIQQPPRTQPFSHGNNTLERKASDVTGRIGLGGWQRLYLNNNHHLGSAIWMEMTRNGNRFNLKGWSLQESPWSSCFGSRSTVVLHPI
eukprot:scaffold31886_cov66-Attheya_sp.AAC.3